METKGVTYNQVQLITMLGYDFAVHSPCLNMARGLEQLTFDTQPNLRQTLQNLVQVFYIDSLLQRFCSQFFCGSKVYLHLEITVGNRTSKR